jgi:hypothetical protein
LDRWPKLSALVSRPPSPVRRASAPP